MGPVTRPGEPPPKPPPSTWTRVTQSVKSALRLGGKKGAKEAQEQVHPQSPHHDPNQGKDVRGKEAQRPGQVHHRNSDDNKIDWQSWPGVTTDQSPHHDPNQVHHRNSDDSGGDWETWHGVTTGYRAPSPQSPHHDPNKEVDVKEQLEAHHDPIKLHPINPHLHPDEPPKTSESDSKGKGRDKDPPSPPPSLHSDDESVAESEVWKTWFKHKLSQARADPNPKQPPSEFQQGSSTGGWK